MFCIIEGKIQALVLLCQTERNFVLLLMILIKILIRNILKLQNGNLKNGKQKIVRDKKFYCLTKQNWRRSAGVHKLQHLVQ